MNDLIKINGTDISVKEHRGVRVCTFKDIDTLHKRPEGTSGRNFRENRERLKEGEDYFFVKPADVQNDEFRRSEINNRGTVLLTETGYLMLAKSMTDDLSWEVQRLLVNNYFTRKQEQYFSFSDFHFTDKDLDNIIQDERELLFMLEHPDIYRKYGYSQTRLARPEKDDWRMRIDENFSRIAEKIGGKDVEKFVLEECFDRLERRFRCNLSIRVANIKKNLLFQGRALPLIRQIGKIDAITADKRLREAFHSVVKDMAHAIGVEAI